MRGHSWLFRAYLVVAALMIAGIGIALADPLALSVLRASVVLLGTGALAAGVLRQRPDARSGWWFIVAGAVLTAAAAIVLAVAPHILSWPGDWWPVVLVGLSLPLFIAGLAQLGRLGAPGAPTRLFDQLDLLDATMVALATFLVLFALVIHPVLVADNALRAAAVIYPLGAMLIFALTVRILFTVGMPSKSLTLLLVAMCAFVGMLVSILVPLLVSGSPQIIPLAGALWITYKVVLGAAGLHPSFGQPRTLRRVRRDALSRPRMALLVAIAIVSPVALGVEIQRAVRIGNDTAGFEIPIVAAAVLSLLLVTRLGLTAHVAQHRADQLVHRSEELADAVREQESLQNHLRYRAMHDPLTGLANRIVLTERMEWTLNRPIGNRQHAVALLDLDGFKDVNDTLGHPVGDELLIEAAHRLLEAVPKEATLARLGGDEFAVLLEDTPPGRALAWAEEVRRSLRRPYHLDDQDLYLSTSIGLLTIGARGPGPTPTEALRDADLALYAAKAAGKNRVTLFYPELRAARLDYSRLARGLRQALARDELAVQYQPIVDLATRRIAGVEALLRWMPRGQPAVDPADFIPVAEETGTIVPIGAWVMREACRAARPWYDTWGITVAVNVSAHQLDDAGFADMVLDALREAGLPGKALTIEITETSLMATAAASDSMAHLSRLRGHQVRVAIDDFGTGYSSLAYVARLPVDIIKIDRSFVQRPNRPEIGARNWSFTRAILQLVDVLHLQAIAEGVETLDQADALRRLRCPFAQGYLFAAAMPPEVLATTLSQTAAVSGHNG